MQKFTTFIIVLCFFLCVHAHAQKLYDQKWMFHEYSLMSFSDDTVLITSVAPPVRLGPGPTTSTTCDRNGNLLFYTSGCFIANKQHRIMVNGDSINADGMYPSPCHVAGSFYIYQSNITLPYPRDTSKYIVFNLTLEDALLPEDFYQPKHLYYHIVDMTKDGGLGAVVEKKQIAVADYLARGSLTALVSDDLQKAWVVAPQFNTNCYYIVPVTSDGVGTSWLQCIGSAYDGSDDGGGQAVFSPDKTKYARIESKNQLVLMRFDTATAIFSAPEELPYQTDYNYGHGVAFSANSRFLYAMADTKLYQFDTDAPNVLASRILVGEINFNIGPGTGGGYLCKLAPDGKIYIPPANSHHWISSIQRPNCPGTLCDFRQHNVYLPNWNYTGINNQPSFRVFEQQYNCDPVSSTELLLPHERPVAAVFPNPNQGRFELVLPDFSGGQLSCFDLAGRSVFERNIPNGVSRFRIEENIPSGAYFVRFTSAHGWVNTMRMVVE